MTKDALDFLSAPDYFETRDAFLRSQGLDPDGDDWAIPDNELVGGFEDDPFDDGWILPREYDAIAGDPWCVVCFEDYAEPGSLVCLMCAYEQQRQQRSEPKRKVA